jgi:superfamily II DNA or RNA helicase
MANPTDRTTVTAGLPPDALRRARQVLYGSGLVSCRQLPDGCLLAVFNRADPPGLATVRVQPARDGRRRDALPPSSSCSACGDDGLCDHAAATLLHWHRHPAGKVVAGTTGEADPAYRGLQAEPLLAAAEKILRSPEAELILRTEKELPHAASKWEKCEFRVELRGGGKTYLGNLNNLRQLHFRDALAGGLRIAQFPSQDRQIIRFLAVSADGEGNKLMLDAETSAEFLHCLCGFPRLYWGNRKIVVHARPAAPVLLYRTVGKDWLLQPALATDGDHLPLNKPRLVMGRAGCWIGMAGEYWWLPGVYDLPGLRNFSRAGEERVDPADMAAFLAHYADRPMPLVPAAAADSAALAMSPTCTLRLGDGGTLVLRLSFDYAGTVVGAGEGGLGRHDGQLWRRDTVREEAAVNELLRFGFRRPKGRPGEFHLADPEATGCFLDEILPGWLKAGREVLLPAATAGAIVPSDAQFQCRIKAEEAEHFDLEPTLTADGQRIGWAPALAAARAGRSYLALVDGPPARLSPVLRSLVLATADLALPTPGGGGILRLARAAMFAWAEQVRQAGGSLPRRIQAAARKLPPKPVDIDTIQDGEALPLPEAFRGTLRPYQQIGIAWVDRMLENGFNPILADEMGLGKTVQALALLAARRARCEAPPAPDLVLCPTSLVENWVEEAERFLPGSRVLALRGPQRDRLWVEVPSADLVVSSYALARRDLARYQDCLFRHLVLDEAQHIKNPETANARACKAIRAGHRLVLTGTPLENRPGELWSIFDFLHPGMLGSRTAFQRRFGDLADEPERQQELVAATGPLILRRRKAEVARDLPPKTEQVIHCEMDEAQRALYERLAAAGRNQCRRLLGGGGDARFDVLATLLRLRQACCHPLLLPEALRADFGPDLPSAKTDLLQELLLEAMDCGSRTLVFSQFTSLLAIIRRWLDAAAIPYEYLDGATQDRLERVNRFNRDPAIPVFLLSLKAGGQGLNLTGADRVILYDPWWNPAVEDQAADRTHRIGQVRHVSSLKLVVRNSVEERILALQAQKRQLFDALVEQPAAETLRGLRDEDFAFLLGEADGPSPS